MGNGEPEGSAKKGRAASGRDEEYEAVAQSYHYTVCSGKLQKAVRRATNREGGGGVSPTG